MYQIDHDEKVPPVVRYDKVPVSDLAADRIPNPVMAFDVKPLPDDNVYVYAVDGTRQQVLDAIQLPTIVNLWMDGKPYVFLPHATHLTIAVQGWSEDFYIEQEVYTTVLCIPYIKVRSVVVQDAQGIFG